jgi:hypothetical protein
MGKKLNTCRNLVGKPEGKGLLGRPGHSVIIKWISRTERWDGIDLINLAESKDQLLDPMNMVVNLWVYKMLRNFLSS